MSDWVSPEEIEDLYLKTLVSEGRQLCRKKICPPASFSLNAGFTFEYFIDSYERYLENKFVEVDDLQKIELVKPFFEGVLRNEYAFIAEGQTSWLQVCATFQTRLKQLVDEDLYAAAEAFHSVKRKGESPYEYGTQLISVYKRAYQVHSLEGIVLRDKFLNSLPLVVRQALLAIRHAQRQPIPFEELIHIAQRIYVETQQEAWKVKPEEPKVSKGTQMPEDPIKRNCSCSKRQLRQEFEPTPIPLQAIDAKCWSQDPPALMTKNILTNVLGEASDSPDQFPEEDASKFDELPGKFILPTMAVRHCQESSKIIRDLKYLIYEELPFPNNPPKRLKEFKRFYSRLSIKEDILFFNDKRVVTEGVAIQLGVQVHIGLGHCGRDRMIHIMSKEVWVPGLPTLLSSLARTCILCQTVKSSSGMVTRPPVHKIKATYPYESCAVDLLQLPSSYGYKYVVALVDDYSRFISAVPLKTKTAREVVNALETRIIPSLVATPHMIRSDRGPEFRSEEYKQMLAAFGIKRHLNPPRAPWVNGRVERLNRSLIQQAAVQDQSGLSWVSELPRTIININQMMHAGLKSSPSQFLLEKAHNNTPAVKLPDQPQQLWQQGSPHFQPYKVNDWVLVKQIYPGNRAEDKVKPKYEGPYRVVHVGSQGMTYKIQHYPSAEIITRHFRHLKPYADIPAKLRRHAYYRQEMFDALPEDLQWPSIREMALLMGTPSMLSTAFSELRGSSSTYTDSFVEPKSQVGVTASNMQNSGQSRDARSTNKSSRRGYVYFRRSHSPDLYFSDTGGVVPAWAEEPSPIRGQGIPAPKLRPSRESSLGPFLEWLDEVNTTGISPITSLYSTLDTSGSLVRPPEIDCEPYIPDNLSQAILSQSSLTSSLGEGLPSLTSALGVNEDPVAVDDDSSLSEVMEGPTFAPYQTRSKGPASKHPWVLDKPI